MRDYYEEFLSLKRSETIQNQVPLVPKTLIGTNGTWFPNDKPKKKDETEDRIIAAAKEYHSPRRIDDQTAIDAYMAKLERVRAGIANYRKLQELLGAWLAQEESQVLAAGRAAEVGGKKNFKRSLRRR